MQKERTSQGSKHKQSGRRLTPAGRNICFALLRAEMGENDVFEARRSPEIINNQKLWGSKNMQHSIWYFSFLCVDFLKTHANESSNSTPDVSWVPLRLGSDNRNQISTWSSEITENLKFEYFCPSGPLNMRDGGECFAPCLKHLLCAAARRNGWKWCRWGPEITRNHQKSGIMSP